MWVSVGKFYMRLDPRECMEQETTQTEETNPGDAAPPRQQVDSYGEPVASERIGEMYYEAYSSALSPERLFVGKYQWMDGEWVRLGMDRHRVSSLFNEDSWPTDD
jgi:hypothetical protein